MVLIDNNVVHQIVWVLFSTILLLCVESTDDDLKYDCAQLEGLCPGRVYDVSCALPQDPELFLQALIFTNNKNSRVIFDAGDSEGDVSCVDDPKYGRICGVLKRNDPFEMKMNFTATKALHEDGIMCFGMTSSGSTHMSTCEASIATTTPDPPSSLQVSSSCSLVTWNKPQVLRGNADKGLDYHVTATLSSAPGSLLHEYTTKDTSLSLYELPIEGIAATYNVCVSSINCVGHSDPICTETTLGNPTLLTPPVVTTTVINSTAIQVQWTASAQLEVDSTLTLCYDIETNFKTYVECVTGSQYTINIQEGHGVYGIRVRTAINEVKGEWSDPSCTVLAVPLPVTIKNHTIATNHNTNITKVSIMVQVFPLSSLLGNCKTVPVTMLELRSGIHVVVVNLKDSDQDPLVSCLEEIVVNFPLSQDNIFITVRAANAVGFSHITEYNIPIMQ